MRKALGQPNDKERREKALFMALLQLEKVSEVEKFLVDLCTPSELQAMADRWEVARLVEKGMPYRKIQELTGVSTATVTRVARSLSHGENGYKLVMDRVTEDKKRA